MSPVIIFRHEDAKQSAIKRIQAIKPDQERPLALWIGPYKKIRTLEANARYWARIGLVSDATGHDRDVLHEYFKRKAFGVQVVEIGGQVVEVTPSSAKATSADFGRLMELVEEFIAEHSIEQSA